MFEPARTAAIIFVLTYGVIGFGPLKPLRLDRAGAALVGATAMLAFGVLSPREAVAAIDFSTLALLFGMMIVVAHLRLAGFFRFLARHALRWAHSPRTLLVLVVALSGLLSALFVNDTACLLLTPLVLETTAALALAPVPFLLAVAMGSNAGSVATIVGNPQNMMVASFSRLSYARFAIVLAPVAIVTLALTAAALLIGFRRELTARHAEAPVVAGDALDTALLRKSLTVAGLLLAALVVGVEPGLAALGTASALLVTRRIEPARIYALIDWSLLVLFAGLFIVVAAIEHTRLVARWLERVPSAHRQSLPTFVAVTSALSNVVSNVPAVLLLRS
jgi:Na+/H+ antiporter NhaD/arsenite permease-like protein